MEIKMSSNKRNIYTSPHDIAHPAPCVLATKKTVYTQALLQKIPHNTEGKVDICLKIGRYKNLGALETDTPKSELTLTDEELNNLIAYIETYYKPLALNVSQFIPLKGDEPVELLCKFKELVGTDEEKAKQILGSGILSENITLAIDLLRKKGAVNSFKQALDCDYPESFWQSWFETNKWMLGSEYLEILDDRKIDSNHIADYLMQAFDGFLDIVEIKKPNGLRFWMDSLDHNNYVPSAELIKAITQCQNYLYEIERESNSAKFLEKTNGTKIIKPRCLLVFGRSINWNNKQREAYRILNASFNQINILTYDHLLQRAQSVMGF